VLIGSVALARGGGKGARATVDALGIATFPLGQRTTAPALAGTSLSGGSISVASLGSGKILFVNVWASWCVPCRAESPMLAAAARALQTKGVQFVGLDEDYRASDGRAFAQHVASPYPSLEDGAGSLLRRLTLLPQSGIPSTLVVDKHGRIAGVVVGQVTRAQVDRLVTELSAES
jgi:thiol-disulfide isomerase/thioredoxin